MNVFLKLRPLEGNVKVELDLCNYATKMDLKNTAVVDTLKFDTSRVDLVRLKSEIDKLDIDTSKTTPVDIIKVSDIGKSAVVKKTEYDKLVKKR